MDDEGWEARMADRYRLRMAAVEVIEQAERELRIAAIEADIAATLGRPEHWLNGWPRLEGSDTVLIGTGVCCIGCGRLLGVATVAFSDDWEPPSEPQWPLAEQDCKFCALRREFLNNAY